MNGYLLVNFGGPRDLTEIAPFLTELLCDRDVIRTRFPRFVHNWLFQRVAKKRALQVRHDYAQIGGKSPIYFDTEAVAQGLAERLEAPVLTFHRYLPATHAATLRQMETMETLKVLPLFPQFCSATTGSVARFFVSRCPHKLHWIRSYAGHPAFIRSYQRRIADCLRSHGLEEEETALLFSAHGVPQEFIDEGDIYQQECELSYREVMQGFPKAHGILAYQSQFGRGEWVRPYTNEVCKEIANYSAGRKKVVIVPISFTSDHIETLFEMEKLYLPLLAAAGMTPYRCPALNTESYWIDALAEIAQEKQLTPTSMLVRRG
jgi:ferrochelatase